jgi:hypothetical protein
MFPLVNKNWMALSISDKVDFGSKNLTKDLKKGLFKSKQDQLIKDMLNIFVSNNRASKYKKQKLMELFKT